MTASTKEQIVAALNTLDVTKDENWTDDGSPRMDVLKKVLDDANLSRATVNDAAPGFNRTKDTTPAADAAAQVATGAPQGETSGDADSEDTPLTELAADLDLDDPTRDKPLDREELRALMKSRIETAAEEIVDRQKDIRDANAALIKAQARHSRLVADINRRFPPLSAASNIKRHLAAHQARAVADVEAGLGISQVDRAMGQSRKVGWTRPARPVGVQIATQ